MAQKKQMLVKAAPLRCHYVMVKNLKYVKMCQKIKCFGCNFGAEYFIEGNLTGAQHSNLLQK